MQRHGTAMLCLALACAAAVAAASTNATAAPNAGARNATGANATTRPVVCPPPGFDSVANFSLAKYISGPWYVQQQMLVDYGPAGGGESELFCVRAR